MSLMTQHAGDCTIYRALINERPEDGICTCGYGWARVTQGDWSQMYSTERDSQGFPLSKQTFPKSNESDDVLRNLDEKLAPRIQAFRDSERYALEPPEDPRAKAVIKRLSDDMAALRADNARLRGALDKLVNKLDAIAADPQFTGVFVTAHARSGVQYQGPNLVQEIKQARAALANDSEIPKGSPEAIPASKGNIPSLDTPKG